MKAYYENLLGGGNLPKSLILESGIELYRIEDLVNLKYQKAYDTIGTLKLSQWGQVTVDTIPEEFRPSYQVFTDVILIQHGGAQFTGSAYIQQNGNVIIESRNTVEIDVYSIDFHIVYTANN